MPPRWFLVVYALSGAAALVYEVAWTRLLTLSFGHGVAAASTVLAAFMGGLAVGAALAGPASDRLTRPRALRLYALAELVVALLALAMPLGLAAFEPLLRGAYGDGAPGATFPLLRLLKRARSSMERSRRWWPAKLKRAFRRDRPPAKT